ncbi:hypothetical protein CDL15_Pgr022601 [Punica granatum]|uniref:ENTH domain-containing protein n=1 Tax=Punica granatum TaxID=22663 RepID=A0A218XRP7_PUNGR|nr:hypothetical protein CDL15_Pgr022601 [Punica granatum]
MSMMLSRSTANSSFNEFKRQASFFLRDKIKTARLKLTDVTHAQLLTEEITNGNPWPPDTRTMGIISRAAFEVDDFWRIVEILHRRLVQFDRKNWRISYNALILLEHLLTHGPQSAVDEFQDDKDVIKEMTQFQFIDKKGFNWGLRVQKLSERVLKLLQERHFWQEERTRARKLTQGIKGFGSFCQRQCSLDVDFENPSVWKMYGRWNSHGNAYDNEEDELLVPNLEEVCTRSRNDSSEPERKQEDVKYFAVMEDHPFCDNGHQGTESLLSKKLR